MGALTTSSEGGSFMLASSTEDGEGELGDQRSTSPSADESRRKDPPIYVYDTPGVMVPFLGHGASGAERGIKLAITAGIKDSLFDVQLLADYLLYRLNLRASSASGLPSYVTNLPLSVDDYLSTCEDAQGRTNSIAELLWHVAGKAPGSLRKGNTRDLDAAAQFMLQHWRAGKLDANTELDLNTTDPAQIQHKIRSFFQSGNELPASTGVTAGPVVLGNPTQDSRTQAKKQQKKQDVLARKRKLMDKGITVGPRKKAIFRGARKRK